MKFTVLTILASSVFANRRDSGPKDCRNHEVWSPRFQQCLKKPKGDKNCKDGERYVYSRDECVKAQECKGQQIWSYRYAQCIKLKGNGFDQQEDYY